MYDKLSGVAEQFKDLERTLVLGRSSKTLSVLEEERILSRLADLWWEMSDAERKEADGRSMMGTRVQKVKGR